MGEFSLTHWLIIALIFLIFFKKDQLPGLGKSIGQSIRGFKTALTEIDVPAKDIKDLKDEKVEDKQASQQQKETETHKS